jgi:ABC-type amino acid transport substrate-binding protein
MNALFSRFKALFLLLLLLGSGLAQADLAQIRERGSLTVAVYNDFWPWANKGSGLDMDIARALGQKLGLKVDFLPFDAKDDMNDDLRNMVWKGHYLGYGPADVMMHVPVDQHLMKGSPQVAIFAPYYQERMSFGYDSQRFPDFSGPDSVAGGLIGVGKDTVAGQLILSVEGGKYIKQSKPFDHQQNLIQALREGSLAMVMASTAEIEAGTTGEPRFKTTPVRYPQLSQRGWAVGLAVKKENAELQAALAKAMDELRDSGELAEIFKKVGVTLVNP